MRAVAAVPPASTAAAVTAPRALRKSSSAFTPFPFFYDLSSFPLSSCPREEEKGEEGKKGSTTLSESILSFFPVQLQSNDDDLTNGLADVETPAPHRERV